MSRPPEIDSALTKYSLTESPAFWREDSLLVRALPASAGWSVSVNSLERPIQLISEPKGNVIAFDYAFFIFLRSLFRSFLEGDMRGALISFHHFAVGRALEEQGLHAHAACLLLNACELRTNHCVYQSCSIYEASLYQLAINLCFAHEQGHHLFEQDKQARTDWMHEAEIFIDSLASHADRMFIDPNERKDFIYQAAQFKSHDLMLEEIACDICALDHAISSVETRNLSDKIYYSNNYYLSARVLILSLFICRNIADTARSIVREIVENRAAALIDIEQRGPEFMSSLRVRFQVMLAKVISLKLRLGLIDEKADFAKIEGLIETAAPAFDRLVANLALELDAVRKGNTIYRCLYVGYARSRDASSNLQDNKDLLALYQREFWFSHLYD